MKQPFKKSPKPSYEDLQIHDFSPAVNLPPEKFLERRRLIKDVVARFKDMFHLVEDIPVYIHPRPLFGFVNDPRVIFGLRATDNCPLKLCKGILYDDERTHLHISAMAVFEFFYDMLHLTESSGLSKEEIVQIRDTIYQMEIIRTTLEELYHYWQNINHPEPSKGIFIQTTQEYQLDPAEIEAKNWSFTETETIIHESFNEDSAEVLIKLLDEMRSRDIPVGNLKKQVTK